MPLLLCASTSFKRSGRDAGGRSKLWPLSSHVSTCFLKSEMCLRASPATRCDFLRYAFQI